MSVDAERRSSVHWHETRGAEQHFAVKKAKKAEKAFCAHNGEPLDAKGKKAKSTRLPP